MLSGKKCVKCLLPKSYFIDEPDAVILVNSSVKSKMKLSRFVTYKLAFVEKCIIFEIFHDFRPKYSARTETRQSLYSTRFGKVYSRKFDSEAIYKIQIIKISSLHRIRWPSQPSRPTFSVRRPYWDI